VNIDGRTANFRSWPCPAGHQWPLLGAPIVCPGLVFVAVSEL